MRLDSLGEILWKGSGTTIKAERHGRNLQTDLGFLHFRMMFSNTWPGTTSTPPRHRTVALAVGLAVALSGIQSHLCDLGLRAQVTLNFVPLLPHLWNETPDHTAFTGLGRMDVIMHTQGADLALMHRPLICVCFIFCPRTWTWRWWSLDNASWPTFHWMLGMDLKV